MDRTERRLLAAVLVGVEQFDPRLERIDVAVQAVWLLYLWGRWSWLAELGLTRAEAFPVLYAFDNLHVIGERGRLTPKQARDLLEFYPGLDLLAAALELTRRYMGLMDTPRRAYYGRLLEGEIDQILRGV